MHRRANAILVGMIAVIGAAIIFLGMELKKKEEQASQFQFAEIPKIDVHAHAPPSMVVSMARLLSGHGVDIVLNASGGHPGEQLGASIHASKSTNGQVHPYCHLDWGYVEDPKFEDYVTQALDACKVQGGIGLKVFKALGLGYLTSDGELLAVDDSRLDRAFEYAGELNLPILIHSGDPQAFFQPATPDNERFAELEAHPSWSFSGVRPDGKPWPSWREIFDQFERRVARHPGTIFIGAHFGNAPESPSLVSAMLSRFPNYYIETGARIPEIGRHDPMRMHDFFVRHRRRILFGTDFQAVPGGVVLGSAGAQVDSLSRVPFFFRSHWRYFETADRGFEHPTPIQGDWTIDGIHLPSGVLEDVYFRNAERIFGIHHSEHLNGS